MNHVFFFIVLISFLFAAATGSMEAMGSAALSSAKASVDISLGLVGYMALFLGLMKVGEEGGLLKLLARAIRPVMSRLFPEIPSDHPALPAMVLNISANMLGLGNAATPLGIKAMHELNKLNQTPGVATNAMVLFLAINTSGVALLPSGVVSFREQAGSADPWGIVAPTLFATLCSTLVGITAAKTLQRLPMFAPPDPSEVEVGEVAELKERDLGKAVDEAAAGLDSGEATWGVYVLGSFLLVASALLVVPPIGAAFMSDAARAAEWRAFADTVGDWVIPVLILSLLSFGYFTGVKVYETFVAGAKEGFEIAVKIIPFLVAILVAVGMFKASGAMDAVLRNVGPITMALGIPPEAVPMALVRPLSGSGASGVMAEVLQSSGPDSYAGYVVSVLNGSTETTFYVLAVYFGSVGVTRIRHAVFAGLAADITGVIATGFICMVLYGHLIAG
ncbi:MAG: spore maturation protein [Deltaproteobacteria bacterium]|nr:MAG: spore maturation protein [Deltaproteobacteria bacterium]